MNMTKKLLILFLFLNYQGKAQQLFAFENDLNYRPYHENLIRLLPKPTLAGVDFQIRLWYAIKRWDLNIMESNLGLLLIFSKNNQLESENFHFLHIQTKIEDGYMINRANVERKKPKTNNIDLDFKKLINDGLLTCKTMKRFDRTREKIAIQRGFDSNKGFLDFHDGYGFTIELINKKNNRRIEGFYPKKYYEHYDKLLYELIPLIKIQKRLFDIADAGMGI